MKRATPFFLTLLLSGCAPSPYYGQPVVETMTGQKVCGVHGTELQEHKGFIFNGFMHGTEDFEFAAKRFPNVLGPNFSSVYDEKFKQTIPHTDYTCDECIQAHEKLKDVPRSIKQSAEKKAQDKRDRALNKAAERARGNPDGARVPDADGWLSRVR